jgi:hypothetical protein
MDKERKRTERSHNDQVYARICNLLGILAKPKNTLADRSEFLCNHPLGGSIERFIVLDTVEVIVERQKVDSDLRQRLHGSEANVRHLKAKLACHSTELTEEDIAPCMLTLLGDSDRGARS